MPARSVRISVIWTVTTSLDSASTTGAGHDARHLVERPRRTPVCKRGAGREGEGCAGLTTADDIFILSAED